jgi:hypothetical protein
MRSQRHAAPTTSPSATVTLTPLAAAFSRIAARARSSISAASTDAAPARHAGDGGDPAAGGEIQHALAGDQNGIVQHVPRQCLTARPGESPERRCQRRSRSQSSVACQIGVISLARCKAISGTSGAKPTRVGADEVEWSGRSPQAGLERANQERQRRRPARPPGWRETARQRSGS